MHNVEYIELAYRRAIFGEIIAFLQRDFTRAFDPDPNKVIISQDLPSTHGSVPQETIQQVINEFQQEDESMRLALLTFEFRKKDDGKEPQGAQGRRRHAPQGQKGRRR